MNARTRHYAGITAASIAGLVAGVLLMLALMARFAHAGTGDESSSPGIVDHALDVAGPLGRGALGGIACLAVAWLLARCRDRWGWLRRGWAGNAAATGYAALATFGGVLAVGGSVGSGLTAVGGAMAAGMAIVRHPETMRAPRPRHDADPKPGEDVPT